MSSEFKVSGDDQFGSFLIKANIVDLGRRTINIRAISLVSIETVTPKIHWLLVLIASIAIAAVGFVLTTPIRYGAPSGGGWGALFGLAPLLISILAANEKKHYLIIRTNDNTPSAFHSSDFDFLMKLKSSLDSRLNGGYDGTNIHVDMSTKIIERATIENLSSTEIQIEKADSIISDSPGAQYAPQSVSPTANYVHSLDLTNSQVTGSLLSGATVDKTSVDFSGVLSDATNLYNRINQDSQILYDHKRMFYELLQLMDSQTVSREDKAKTRDLASTLGQVFQSYPGAAQMFQHIVALVT